MTKLVSRSTELASMIAMALALVAHPARAETCEAVGGARCYYVSLTGADELSPTDDCQNLPQVDCGTGGTIGAPWRSLAKAASCVKPGDFVYVRAGTYGASCTTYPNGATYGFYSLRSGTAAAPITIKAYPGEAVTMTEGIQINHPRAEGHHGDYTVVEGFEVVGKPIVVRGSNVVVRKNHVHDVNGLCSNNNAGIYLDNGVQGALVEENVVHDNFERTNGDDWRDVGGFSMNCGGIKVMHDPTDVVIRGNVIYNEPAGIHLKYFAEGKGTRIEGNRIYDVGAAVFGKNDDWTFTNNVVYRARLGLSVGGAEGPARGGFGVVIERNTFADNEVAIDLLGGDARVEKNVFARADAPHQLYIYNGYYGAGDGFPDFDLTPLTLRENCYHTAGKIARYGHGGQPNYDYDLSEMQSTFDQEVGSVFSDPQFTNAAAQDYRIPETSPCAGMGSTAGADDGPEPPDGGAPGPGREPSGDGDAGAHADGSDPAGSGAAAESSGCACAVHGARSSTLGGLLFAMGLALASARRRARSE